MAPPRTNPKILEEAIALVELHGSLMEASRATGIPYSTLQHRVNRQRGLAQPTQVEYEMDELPDEIAPIEELLARRKRQFDRKQEAIQARALIPVRVKLDGPIGIAHFGDPHVDDDGTDISLLESHIRVINDTPGLFAGNVGDNSNNWVGRLSRLYGQQSTSQAEAWKLVEWLIGAVPWLYLVGGNHDVWSGEGDPIQWMSRFYGSNYSWFGARLGLKFPNGNTVRINARHDFAGHSMWNTAHGPAKAAMMGWKDHVLTCGHKHTSGYQMVLDPATGLISHALRVGTYKVYDHYAQEKGLPNQNAFCCPVTIIDPQFPDSDVRMITVIFDPHEAADYLTWKRKKAGCDAPVVHRRPAKKRR